MIKADPDQVRFSMIEQTNDSIGNCREQLIKNWFRIIIENIIDDWLKATIAWIDNTPQSKISTLWKSSYNGKMKSKRFKTSDENEITRFINDIQFSDDILKEWTSWWKTFKIDIEKLRKMVKKLVKLRNNILNLLKRMHESWNKDGTEYNYTKQDFISMITLANRFKNTKYTTLSLYVISFF